LYGKTGKLTRCAISPAFWWFFQIWNPISGSEVIANFANPLEIRKPSQAISACRADERKSARAAHGFRGSQRV
jgi:hypothetical protein